MFSHLWVAQDAKKLNIKYSSNCFLQQFLFYFFSALLPLGTLSSDAYLRFLVWLVFFQSSLFTLAISKGIAIEY